MACSSCKTGYHFEFGELLCQKCGDEVATGNEVCDDGVGGSCSDDCSEICTAGIFVNPSTGLCDPHFCGNFEVGIGEICDDGDDIACKSDCSGCETGFKISNNVCLPSICQNGILEFDEECDGGLGCDSSCRCYLPSYSPSTPLSQDCSCSFGFELDGFECMKICAVFTGTEECFDMNNIDGDGCSSEC